MSKVKINIFFDTDLSYEAVGLLSEELKAILTRHQVYNQSLELSFDPSFKGRVKVFEISVEEFFKNLSSGKRVFSFGGKDYLVKMNSQRYFMFKENCSCVCCGLKGTRMFLEYHLNDMTPHFNLYGEIEGELVLMTKDHILAKALGGEDRHSNYQTMCSTCNGLKGHASLTLDSLKTLRRVFDEKKSKMTKKQVHYFLEECKRQLKKKEKSVRNNAPDRGSVVLNCDSACFVDDKGNIYSRHIYENSSHKRIGCMKKGTHLVPILEYKGDVVCCLGDRDSIRVPKKNLSGI